MPGKGGLAWLEEGEWPWPLLPVILMTGHGTIDALFYYILIIFSYVLYSQDINDIVVIVNPFLIIKSS
jgi:DNA-binding NtrC family response regulator